MATGGYDAPASEGNVQYLTELVKFKIPGGHNVAGGKANLERMQYDRLEAKRGVSDLCKMITSLRTVSVSQRLPLSAASLSRLLLSCCPRP
jgi:hypothetical protein